MIKRSLTTLLMLGALLLAHSATAANLVVNGDFGNGNTGFYTNYAYADIQGHTQYTITSNPHLLHPASVDLFDHTSGSGLMMAVNGSNNGSNVVWQQEVDVVTGEDYIFSIWLANWTSSYRAVLDVKINGASLWAGYISQGGLGLWGEFSKTWNSGSTTTALIQIYDREGAVGGNDFALDDISLTGPPTAVPVPASALLLLAGGLLGAALKTRGKEKS